MENFKEKLNRIKCFIFDVDGVLTNGSLIIMPDGEMLRTMNIKDGYAMQLAIKKGYHMAIISGGKSEGVPVRLQRLGITEVHMQVKNKIKVYADLKEKYALTDEQILYMGDDLPDLEIMHQVGLAACPEDACTEVKAIAIYRSLKKGGEGCVRDLIEQVMRLHGNWEEQE
jgi:3-deoxy-D-manno-octulosonate 8-phosphate phosphatase (KDO 8-P phosphatase)